MSHPADHIEFNYPAGSQVSIGVSTLIHWCNLLFRGHPKSFFKKHRGGLESQNKGGTSSIVGGWWKRKWREARGCYRYGNQFMIYGCFRKRRYPQNHPFWGIPIFGNTRIYIYTVYIYIWLESWMSGLGQMRWFEGSSWWGFWAYMMYTYIYIYIQSHIWRSHHRGCVSCIFHAQLVTIRCATSLVSLRTGFLMGRSQWGGVCWVFTVGHQGGLGMDSLHSSVVRCCNLSRIPVSWMWKVDERCFTGCLWKPRFFRHWSEGPRWSETFEEFNEIQNVISVIVTWFNASL